MGLLFLIAVSLSMDAFSLALAYGTLGMSKNEKILLSSIVGMFHFFMPLLGILFGKIIFNFIGFNSNLLVAGLLSFIGISMIISIFKENDVVKKMKVPDFFVFALAVSIDSFSVGITLLDMNVNPILAPFVFALVSGSFTFFGLHLGNKIEKLLGKIATVIGGVILTIIGISFCF